MSLEKVADDIIEEIAGMSGKVLWRVTGTWANKGRTGAIDEVVEAETAAEALALAWVVEDDRDIRTAIVEWLCPVEMVKRKEIFDVKAT